MVNHANTCTILLSNLFFVVLAVFVYRYLFSQAPIDVTKRVQEEFKKEFLIKTPVRVGVIGSGIAGASVSLYLKEIFGSDIQIHVYEQNNRTGGRVMKQYMNNTKLDVGATSIILENRYAVELINRFDLRFSDKMPESMVIWDAEKKQIAFQESKWGWLTLIKLLLKYKQSLFTLRREINAMLSKFLQIYELQDDLQTWTSWEELFNKIELFNYTQLSFEDKYSKVFSEDFLKDILEPMIRVNYLQNRSISAFAGAVVCSAFVSKFHEIHQGTDEIAARALAASKATVELNTRVTMLEKIGDEIAVTATHCSDKCEEKVEKYDIVILAAPLEQAKLKFKNMTLPASASYNRKARKTFVTFVMGELNPKYVGLEYSDPSKPLVMIVKDTEMTPVVSAFVKGLVPQENGEPKKIYKVFSTAELSEEMLNQLFSKREATQRHWWYAYPFLNPTKPTNWHPIILSENLYYINSMESVISTMETELISSRNIALLIAKSLFSRSSN